MFRQQEGFAQKAERRAAILNERLEAAERPVLADVDAAVVGGSFAGIACAAGLAKAGRRVMVIEPRTYLGREWSATMRYWLDLPASTDLGRGEPKGGGSAVQSGADNAALPSLIRYVLERSGADTAAGSPVPIHPDRFKRALEDLLEENGIDLIYATLPVAVMTERGRAAGLVVANKAGRQIVRCGLVVDATETALIAALCGEDVGGGRMAAASTETPAAGKPALAEYRRTLEFVGVDGEVESAIQVPESIGICDQRVRMRQGYRGAGHVLAEFGLMLPSANRMEADRDRERQARHVGIALAAHLIGSEPAFRKAVLAGASHELHGPVVAGNDAVADRGQHQGAACGTNGDRYACSLPGVYSLFLPDHRDGAFKLLCAVAASRTGADLAAAIAGGADPWENRRSTVGGTLPISPSLREDEAEEHSPISPSLREAETEERSPSSPSLRKSDASPSECEAPLGGPPEIRFRCEVEVLVVGGGSSGASAAIRAATEGRNTLLLDLNPGLGGTGTYGGVDSYWFGRRTGYMTRIQDAVATVQRMLHYKGHKWNIEAKSYALLKEAEMSGSDGLFNVITYDAIKTGNQVRGAVAATRWGPLAVEAKVVIDATGDGDVAVFAGASYVYGSEKDHAVMWYSLAQFEEPARVQNNFTSMVDVGGARDYTRAILAGRRRGSSGIHDHGIYVATRESRHVRGDVVMTLADQLLHRRWTDVVNVHFSNHDVKGVSGADWVNVGLIPPNLEIEIPYGMLLPQGLDGILVAGKAISATHDALPAIRMQSDLENLGAIAAIAASEAVRQGVPPRRIDVRALQARLARDGLLPAGTEDRQLAALKYTDEDLRQLVGRIETNPLFEYADMRMNEVYRERLPFVEIVSAGPRIVPILEKAIAEATGVRRIRLAQALSMLGSTAGVPALVEAIMRDLQGDALPVRTADIMYVQLPPDHGAMPDAAYLLYSLAQAKDKRSIPVWERVAERMQPVREEDFKDSLKGIYYFVDAVCQGAERLGDRGAIPALEEIHRNPWLNGLACPNGYQPDYFLERRAMLELALARALARCGSREGYEILIRYVGDARSLLSKQALLELCRLSEGEDRRCGSDPELWLRWLETDRPELETKPLNIQLDRVDGSEGMLRVTVRH